VKGHDLTFALGEVAVVEVSRSHGLSQSYGAEGSPPFLL
jgi:hypothetical protein